VKAAAAPVPTGRMGPPGEETTMTRAAWVLLLGLGVLAWAPAAGRADDKKDDKGTVVEIDGLKSQAPAGWKVEEPSNKLRTHQIRIPKAKGDKDDAELVVFYFGEGGGGGTAENIKRWKGLMIPPEGKKIDDVSKVEELKAGNVKMTLLDVTGTYLYKEKPFDPNAKAEKRPDYRLMGVVFESPKGPYFMRLVGPAKTVGENDKAFKEWLKNFK
jgi:hypothetical protein